MSSLASDFHRLMAGLGPWGERQAVAVSGGADSLCLAWLLKQWGDPFALIVDHGLRPESAYEAALTRDRLASFDVPSRTLELSGLQPGPALASRARDARYAALVSACAGLGLTDLLLGHHAGDQAETVLMRQEASSGRNGLAGMAAITYRRTVRLVRPLLGVDPATLQATLQAAGLQWIEDPSNRNLAALRTRLRVRLEQDTIGLAGRLTALAADNRDARTRAAARIASTLAQRAQIFPGGYATLTPGPIAPDCLGALIRMLGGRPYGPNTQKLARLAAAPAAATLGGVRIMAAGKSGPGLLLIREEAAQGPDLAVENGATWDNRFVVSAPEHTPTGLCIAAVAAAAASLRRLSELPAAVLRTLPGIWHNGTLCDVPHLALTSRNHAFTGWTNCGVKLTLCPPHPAASGG